MDIERAIEFLLQTAADHEIRLQRIDSEIGEIADFLRDAVGHVLVANAGADPRWDDVLDGDSDRS